MKSKTEFNGTDFFTTMGLMFGLGMMTESSARNQVDISIPGWTTPYLFVFIAIIAGIFTWRVIRRA